MCQRVFAFRLQSQQPQWGCGLRGFCVQMPAAGKAGIQDSYWLLEPRFWRTPSWMCPFFINRLSLWLARKRTRMSPSVLVRISWVLWFMYVLICVCTEVRTCVHVVGTCVYVCLLGSWSWKHKAEESSLCQAVRLGSSPKYLLRTACSK